MSGLRRNKFNAVATTVDGIRFASKKEAKRYGELTLMEKAGLIIGLRCQPRMVLRAYGPNHEQIDVADYVADFMYFDVATRRQMIEDVKSPATRTPLYRLKKKLAEACHGITITEV